MFDIKSVINLHDKILAKYGGASGVRDSNLLDSALNRPFQTFGGEDLYSSFYEKAAAVIQSIIINHPFVDGNKRIGYYMARAIFLNYALDINASENDKYDFVIAIAQGKLEVEEIANWFLQHTKNL